MKLPFKKMSALLTLFATAISLVLTSCGDDNEPDSPTPELAKVDVAYKVSLSPNWFEFMDVTMEYVNESGIAQTTKLTQSTELSVSIPASKVPSEIRFKVTASPKENAPQPENQEYIFTESYSFKVIPTDTNGNVYGNPMQDSSGDEMTVDSEGMEIMMQETLVLYDKSYRLTK